MDMSSEQRFTFDEVATLYDRVRPRYPPEFLAAVVELAELAPGDRVLEIGCGTGQASEGLAAGGLRMLCLEPGVALADRARTNLRRFSDVEVVESTFEAWSLEAEAFDAIVCAQAFHWVDPELRFSKAAAALRPGGSLAVFGHVSRLDASPLRPALDAAYARHAPSLLGPSVTAWYSAEGPLQRDFAASGRFERVSHRRHDWARSFTTRDYLDLMQTYSEHRMLDELSLAALLAAVAEVIEAAGGSIEIRYDANLYIARRK